MKALEALRWMESRRRGYAAAAKRFGVSEEDIRAARDAEKAERAPPPAPRAPPRAPSAPPPAAEGVELVSWYRAEIRALDEAADEATPRDRGHLAKVRADLIERLHVLEAAEAVNDDLAEPALLLEAVLAELEGSIHLLTEEQADRFIQAAFQLGRMHDTEIRYAAPEAS